MFEKGRAGVLFLYPAGGGKVVSITLELPHFNVHFFAADRGFVFRWILDLIFV